MTEDTRRYPISGVIWFRDSTNEWVLELSGEINGCQFTSRHTESASTAPEDVAGLPSHYASIPNSAFLTKAIEQLEQMTDSEFVAFAQERQLITKPSLFESIKSFFKRR